MSTPNSVTNVDVQDLHDIVSFCSIFNDITPHRDKIAYPNAFLLQWILSTYVKTNINKNYKAPRAVELASQQMTNFNLTTILFGTDVFFKMRRNKFQFLEYIKKICFPFKHKRILNVHVNTVFLGISVEQALERDSRV